MAKEREESAGEAASESPSRGPTDDPPAGRANETPGFAEAASRQASQALGGMKRFYERFAPWIALTLGATTRFLSHRTVDFAPKAVALVALAWLLPVIVARWLPAHAADAGKPLPRWRTTVRDASTFLVVVLFRNVLFFLVPVWLGSATWSSLNVLFPLGLAGMALYSCFKERYQRHVLEKPGSRAAWTSIVLFAALVPALAVAVAVSPRVAIGLAAVGALLFGGAATAPVGTRWSRPFLRRLALVAAGNALVLVLVPGVLPPVPLACHKAAVGTGLHDRELVGESGHFPAGTRKVYAWFLVTLPDVYRQEIRFVWSHDGHAVGRPFVSALAGGRKRGFRTWTSLNAPARGRWSVDLLTDAGQLIGRAAFAID